MPASSGSAKRPDQSVPTAAVGRMSLYLRQLQRFLREGRPTVSSRELGQPLGIDAAQVRKDLAYFGQFGRSGVGYPAAELTDRLRRILGTDRRRSIALVGVGHLGQALMRYRGFRAQGFHVVALFDRDPAKVGREMNGLRVWHVDELPAVAQRLRVELGIVAVPADAAQQVANKLVEAGVQGILNFAPTPVSVPEHVSLVSVDLAIQLEILSYRSRAAQRGGPRAEGKGDRRPGR